MAFGFLLIPATILEEIASHVVELSLLGPPSELYALLLTCRCLYNALSVHSCPSLYARIFGHKFDTAALVRRLCPDLSLRVGSELRRRFTGIQCFRRGCLHDAGLLEAFMTAYLMLLEDDGKNMAQLEWAGLPVLVSKFIRCRLHEESHSNNGWPLDNEINALAISLFWLLSLEPFVGTETNVDYSEICDLIAPYAYSAQHYPLSTTAEHEFHPEQKSCSETFADETHTFGYRRSRRLTYFGQPFEFQLPSTTAYAILSYLSIVERRPIRVPDGHSMPKTAADVTSFPGLAIEDIEDYNSTCRSKSVQMIGQIPINVLSKSQVHDLDWTRALSLWEPLPKAYLSMSHRLGALTGLWNGTCLVPSTDSDKFDLPTAVRRSYRIPLQCRLREHYRYIDASHVPSSINEHGFLNAWWPDGCRYNQTSDGIEILNESGSVIAYYKTLPDGVSGGVDPACDVRSAYGPDTSTLNRRSQGVIDIILTGETDPRHGDAWGAFRFFGRVRPSDGLIVMVREPADKTDPVMLGLGRDIFRGYLLSSENIVGRRRAVLSGTKATCYETLWNLHRSKG